MSSFIQSIVDPKSILICMILICSICSCTNSPNASRVNQDYLVSQSNEQDSLTTQQIIAFEALNTLQMGTDKMNRLYSTFPNIEHSCYPFDTSFMISQQEFLMAMKVFVSLHCKNLSEEERNKLAAASVLAQEKYVLNYCHNDIIDPDFENGPSYSGVWILPNIQSRSDLTLIW